MLDENVITIGKENREKVCFRIFNLLSKNQWFIHDNPKLAHTTFNKLLQFEQEETSILDPLHYIRIIFPNYNLVQINI